MNLLSGSSGAPNPRPRVRGAAFSFIPEQFLPFVSTHTCCVEILSAPVGPVRRVSVTFHRAYASCF